MVVVVVGPSDSIGNLASIRIPRICYDQLQGVTFAVFSLHCAIFIPMQISCVVNWADSCVKPFLFDSWFKCKICGKIIALKHCSVCVKWSICLQWTGTISVPMYWRNKQTSILMHGWLAPPEMFNLCFHTASECWSSICAFVALANLRYINALNNNNNMTHKKSWSS